jgi:hypothetical protein
MIHFLLAALLTSSEVTVNENYYPKMPVPPPPPELGIEKNIKGIIVTRPDDDMWQQRYKDFQGIEISGLQVPGGEEGLIQELQPYLGQSLSVVNVEAIKATIVNYYSRHGVNIFVEVVQDYISSGVLELIVIQPFKNNELDDTFEVSEHTQMDSKVGF